MTRNVPQISSKLRRFSQTKGCTLDLLRIDNTEEGLDDQHWKKLEGTCLPYLLKSDMRNVPQTFFELTRYRGRTVMKHLENAISRSWKSLWKTKYSVIFWKSHEIDAKKNMKKRLTMRFEFKLWQKFNGEGSVCCHKAVCFCHQFFQGEMLETPGKCSFNVNWPYSD